MPQAQKSHFVGKIIIISILIAALVYFFHPGVGQFGLIINGEPVADPLIRLAALPTLIIALLFTVVLIILAFLGVGMFIFIGGLGLILLGIFFLAPYFWPILVIITLIILVMSFGSTDK
ncbi:conserved hypothetical protein, membrane [methanotrophic bacterial endosymbiont of Bathymodiolus sp.]|nr:conserved hypothetical protein, membrane [methanotrophic bacterial endosymbiont of Bathymodiolus sp.]